MKGYFSFTAVLYFTYTACPINPTPNRSIVCGSGTGFDVAVKSLKMIVPYFE
jgi:hypothetical protein